MDTVMQLRQEPLLMYSREGYGISKKYIFSEWSSAQEILSNKTINSFLTVP